MRFIAQSRPRGAATDAAQLAIELARLGIEPVSCIWSDPAMVVELVTIEFIESDGATELSLTHEQLPEYMAQAHVGGWTSALDKLASRVERFRVAQ